MDKISIVYTTHESSEAALALANKAVEAGLAACVNVLPDMVSVYKWQGVVEEHEEVVMLFKTNTAKVEELKSWIEKYHSYDTPAILIWDAGTTSGYFQFIVQRAHT